MNYQDMATKFWELHKADEFPSHAQMIGIRLFADWLEEEVDSESDEQLLEDENEDYMSMAHEEDDLWDDLIEETDYLEEDDE